jgi:hypothetical protein
MLYLSKVRSDCLTLTPDGTSQGVVVLTMDQVPPGRDSHTYIGIGDGWQADFPCRTSESGRDPPCEPNTELLVSSKRQCSPINRQG